MSAARTAHSTTQPPQPRPLFESQSLVESLRHQIRKLETVGRADDAKVVSTGCRELDPLLPDGGLATGTITEWLTPASGCGAELLSLLAAKQACADGGALVIVDPEHSFYPPAAAAWGINLQNVIVLRNGTRSEIGGRRSEGRVRSEKSSIPTCYLPPAACNLLWAIDQSLRCPAVAAVWGRLGQVGERWLRRFQLSAEQSGAMGMFVRPASVKGQPGWSEVQWEVQKGRKSEVGGRKSDGKMKTRSGISNLKSQSSSLQSEISNLKSQIPSSEFSSSLSDLRPPTSGLSSTSDLSSTSMSAPMRRAYERVLQEKDARSASSFDRFISLRLLRVRSGHAENHQNITMQIDFTTGKVQTVTGIHEQPDKQQGTGSKQEHSVRLAAQLAHPKTGGRRQRA